MQHFGKRTGLTDHDGGRIDISVTGISILLTLLVAVPILIWPQKGADVTNTINTFMLENFGFYYIWFGLASVAFCLWVAFSKYGRIKMGRPDEKPQYKLFSWVAMLFCAGVGGGVVYWGFIEWAYYYSGPPLGIEAGTLEAAQVAAAYPAFHWGLFGWAIYAVASCAIGYLIHIKGGSIFKISEACRGALGDKVDGWLGKVIDIGFIFGLIGGIATSLGLGTPLITAALSRVFGIADSIGLRIVVLFVICALFGTSAYLGLDKGIKNLSNVNTVLTFFVLLFILFAGDTVFILNMGTTALGYIAGNLLEMGTWLDPMNISGNFPENWTIFYWAWWIAFGPFQGMFFAKISRGRTMRQMLLGTLGFGTLGTFLFFTIFGNFGLSMELNGIVDIIPLLAEQGAPNTIVELVSNLPFGKMMVFLVACLCIGYLATTYDSSSYVLAMASQSKVGKSGEPIRALRLGWALALSIIPVAFILIGSPLSPLQTVSTIAALPVSIIIILTAVAFIRDARDLQTYAPAQEDSQHIAEEQ